MGSTLRVMTMVLAFPNTALLLVLAYHFRALGHSQPAGIKPLVNDVVFSWASVFYVGAALLDSAMSVRQIVAFREPFNIALPFLFLGQAVCTVGLVNLFRVLAPRTW
jgi:hypothetical protein